jgi:hypothetical protein
VNSSNVYAPAFRFLIAASTAGQMQAALTAVMFNYYADAYALQNVPFPKFIPFPACPASNAVAAQSGGPFPVAPTVVTQALIGSWTA